MNEWDWDFGPNYVDHIYPWRDTYGLREVPNEEIIITAYNETTTYAGPLPVGERYRYPEPPIKCPDDCPDRGTWGAGGSPRGHYWYSHSGGGFVAHAPYFEREHKLVP